MSVLNALPTTFRSHPVFPYMPNRDGDRSHSWDWPADVSAIPSGLTIDSVRLAQGRETMTLGFVGLPRVDARALEQFVEDRAGRFEGFWCPTFQHDFHAVKREDLPGGGSSSWPGGQVGVREWGYTDNVWPLGAGYRKIAAYRPGVVDGTWYLAQWEPHGSPVTEDHTTNILSGWNISGGGDAGNSAVVGNSNTQGVSTGLMISRLLWCRFADDAITTEWSHPHLASITLSVVSNSDHAPS